MNRLIGLVIVAGSLAMVSGCGGNTPAPETPASADTSNELTPEQQAALAAAEEETGQGGLKFDDEVLKLCPSAKPSHFDYNSANVRDRYRSSLVELAKCMKDGGLKDKNLLLVGHADPRGEDDYNLALGGRRADAVRGALTSFGVTRSRVDVSSRGEVDAKGTDEDGWHQDRRVEVKLKM